MPCASKRLSNPVPRTAKAHDAAADEYHDETALESSSLIADE